MSHESSAQTLPELPQRLLFLLCQPRYVKVIVEEMGDWYQEYGGRILRYGYSDKARDGFVLMGWPLPVPDKLLEKLKREDDMLDFVLVYTSQQSVVATP